jgi:hypothetical protein
MGQDSVAVALIEQERLVSMTLAYLVTAAAYFVYALSLWVRRRNLRRQTGL